MSHIQLQPSTTPVPEAQGWTPSVKQADKAPDVMSQLEVMTARSDVGLQLRRILFELAHREDNQILRGGRDLAHEVVSIDKFRAPFPFIRRLR